MATSSIMRNIVLDDPEAIKKFCKGLEQAEFNSRFRDVKKNKYGNNTNIKINVLPSLEMKKIGFRECDDTWQYYKMIGLYSEISFRLIINKKHTDDFCIEVMDEDFGIYFDYQGRLLKNCNDKLGLEVQEAVEEQMEYLHSVGVVNGHKRGDFI